MSFQQKRESESNATDLKSNAGATVPMAHELCLAGLRERQYSSTVISSRHFNDRVRRRLREILIGANHCGEWK